MLLKQISLVFRQPNIIISCVSILLLLQGLHYSVNGYVGKAADKGIELKPGHTVVFPSTKDCQEDRTKQDQNINFVTHIADQNV